MAKRIATMLLNKNNSPSCPLNVAGGQIQRERSSSTTDIPDSPFIATNPDSVPKSKSSYYLTARDLEISKALSLRSLSSMVSLRKELSSGSFIKMKYKPGEPILVSARPRASRSGSLSGIYHSVDAKQVLMVC